MPATSLASRHRGREREGSPVIRTLIADRMALIRAGLAACIAREPDIEIIAELDRPEPVLPAAATLHPDVAVLDNAIAAADSYAILHHLHASVPCCRTLIIATQPCPRDLCRAVAAHATGFLRKDTDPDTLRHAIRQAAHGLKALDPDLAYAALDTPPNPLTPRETQVLRLAAAGAPTAEIARQLCLTAGTIRNHISAILLKTGARNRIDIIRIAQHSGWL
jgi:two-component system, NarL family, response regulator DesR